ncbi:hypothetical protein OGAPHI_000969 [Ogataea philodendri]|uniref:PCI domain-containing protein n=1 Tax=Ogataea philodendri TaxID=1378263 RepID=A0A9P8PFT7_9ASCO|nr:uncharacterized protein OGAPHI_000969 [Ogataea philodendri]KAH3670454.1 hypothetical protein OGAPHI_000969 [Ogataea philodendri]
MSLEDHLRAIQNSIQSNTLHVTLSINPTSSHIAPLQKALQSYSNSQLMSNIEKIGYFDNNWPSFESLVQNYLIFVRDFDPWSLQRSVDLLIKFYESLSVALNNAQNAKLLVLVKESTSQIVPVAKLADQRLMNATGRINDYPRLSYMSTLLLKSLNNIRNDPELGIPSKRFKISILMFLSITLCQTYMSIDSVMLCNNVFSNINILNLDKSLISRKQLIQYRFMLGKFHLLQSNYYLAYHHFDWCFSNCHQQTPLKNILLILKYLIPSGLLVGRCPNLAYLQSQLGNHHLLQLYAPLIQCYKNGDLFSFSKLVATNQQYFANLGILVGFLQRVRILILRNLIQKVYKLQGGLSFETVGRALRLSIDPDQTRSYFGSKSLWMYTITNGDLDESFTETLLMTLIDANLLKAKLTPSKTIILSKSGLFPAAYNVYANSYKKNEKERWLE